MDLLDYLFLLELVLITLKVTGYLTCSWIWIFAPVLLLIVFVLCLIVLCIIGAVFDS